jgi:hypothetical protein
MHASEAGGPSPVLPGLMMGISILKKSREDHDVGTEDCYSQSIYTCDSGGGG